MRDHIKLSLYINEHLLNIGFRPSVSNYICMPFQWEDNMVDKPKRVHRGPDYFGLESTAICSPIPAKKKDNALYEIDVKEVDRDRNLVCIHYKGYSSNYDGGQLEMLILTENIFSLCGGKKRCQLYQEKV